MSDTEIVHMFWHGGELPPLEQACVQSFVARGHTVRIHTYHPLRLPAGARRIDAREVIPDTDLLYRLCAPASITAFADCFRYTLLFERGGWWMDTDVLCLTEELPVSERAWAEQEPGLINNAIMKFPKGDPLAGRLAALARERARPGLRWGAIGPDLMTEILAGCDGVHAPDLRQEFYPLHWREAHFLWLPEHRDDVTQRLSGARFLHCWAQALANSGIDPARRAPSGSYLAEIMNGAPGARPLTPWHEMRTRHAIGRRSAHGRRERAASVTLLDDALTWVRRRVVIPLSAARRGLRVPPGRLEPIQHRIDTDRMFFLDCAKRHGPVFKALVNDSYTTCLVGHERGARLIARNEHRLSGYTVDLEGLFPIGALRGMTGETHRNYRRQFLHAVQATPIEAHTAEIDRSVRAALRTMAAAPEPVAGAALRDRLRRLSGAVTMRVLYGIDADTPEHGALETLYRRFGPEAPVNRIDDPHAEAFAEISARLREHAGRAAGADGPETPPCMLRHVARSGETDATTMGNLAYMFEAAHFDLYSLWHWILKFVAEDPGVQSAYAERSDPDGRRAYAVAIVRETLRMEQSELLYWRVSEDIAFDGYLIPRGTTLRVCIWEGHKDPTTFPEPFRFRPQRFLENSYGLDAFAPFGLGQRRCLGANMVIELSTMLVQALLDGYWLESAGDATPVKGPYHWQPGPGFGVRLRRREPPGASHPKR